MDTMFYHNNRYVTNIKVGATFISLVPQVGVALKKIKP